ncbi:MAG: hypothetical protein ACRDVW_01195, partial [Acidimicrobiales bacterium]
FKVAVISSAGTVNVPPQRSTGGPVGRVVSFASPQRATGIVIEAPPGDVHEDTSVTTASGASYRLDGPFQQALGQASWHMTGLWHAYARFRTEKMAPAITVTGAPGATVRRISTTQWGTETDVVDTTSAATVVRSEAYLAGWRVEATPVGGGPTRVLRVFPVGLIQGVRVPAGRWTLTFGYWPSGLTSGGIISALGVVGALVVSVVLLERRRSMGRTRPARGR